MKEDVIIVLENEERYLILNIIEYNEKKYYFSIEINEDLEIMKDKIAFLEEKKSDNKVLVQKVNNEDLIIELIKLTKNI